MLKAGGLLISMLCAQSAHAQSYIERPAVRAFVARISQQHDLDQQQVAGLFAKIQPVQSVLDSISRPAEKVLTWADYRPIFIKQKRIDAGRAFLQQHREAFKRAEREYGVPASIIAAIIGVETFYGRITGKYGVLESVATLAFDYPPRSTFFTTELAEFVVLAQAEGWDTLAIKGSYAGAMGLPQFISSSYRAYAVDFDGDGKRDLFNSTDDVIGSVANYLARHGWQPGEPITQRLSSDSATKRDNLMKLLRKSLKPVIAPGVLRNAGYAVTGKKHVSVTKFDGSGGEEFWVGYKNFYAITRYNHSAMYALAVYQLSAELQ